MAAPPNERLAKALRLIREAVDKLDPHQTTPFALRELVIEWGAREEAFGGAIFQAAILAPHQGLLGKKEQGKGGKQGQKPGSGSGGGAGASGGCGGCGGGCGGGAGRGAGAGAGSA